MTITFKNITTRILKWSLLAVAFLLVLILAIFLLLQTRFGQDMLRDQAVRYLSGKLQTRVAIGRIELDLRKGVKLTKLLLEDRQKRTLLSVGNLEADINLLSLLSSQARFERIALKDASINIYREAGSEHFNFAFIPEAFITAPVEPENPADSTAAFLITLGKIDLSSVRFLMDDQYGKQKYTVGLGSLTADLGKSDINALQFRASHLYTKDINATMSMWGTGGTNTPDTSASPNMLFVADTAALERTTLSMHQQENILTLKTNAGLLTTSSLSFDLNQQLARAKSILLKDHSTSLEMSSAETPSSTTATTATAKPFLFSVDTLQIVNNGFTYHNNTHKPSAYKNSFDPNHLQLEDINIAVGRTSFDGSTYRSNIGLLNGKEKSGFTIKQVSGQVEYADSLLSAKNMVLTTGQNNINATVLVTNLQASDPEKIGIEGSINTRALQIVELLYFQPELAKNEYVRPLLSKRFNINTKIDGNLGHLFIPSLMIKEGGTSLIAKADILHATDPKKMIVNLDLNSLRSSRKELLALMPPKLIPDSLLHYIPQTFAISGTYKGSTDNFSTDLKLNTSLGNARIKGQIRQFSDPANMSYDLTGNLAQLDLGNLLSDTSIGKISGHFKAKGRGTNPATANANISTHIEKASYRGYNYEKIDLTATVKNSLANATVNSSDPNIDMNANVSMDLAGKSRSLNAEADIRNVDFRQLHLMEDSLTYSGNLMGHFPEISEDRINGDLAITNSLINYRNKPLALDTVSLKASHASDTQYIALKTPFATGTINGKYNLTSLASASTKMINTYLTKGYADTTAMAPSQAAVNFQVNLPDSLVSMVDGLKSVSPFNVDATINSATNDLNFNTVLPSIRYQDMKIDSIGIFAHTTDNALNGGLRISKLEAPSYKLNETRADFSATDGTIEARIRLQDEDNRPRYMLPFAFTNDPTRPSLHIRDSLLINRKLWSVNPDNILYIKPGQMQGSTLFLSKGNSSLGFKALGNGADGLPIELDIQDFNISNITEMLIADTSIATGVINGKTTISSLAPLSFNTSIRADSLTAYGAKLGTLSIDVDNKDSSVLNIKTSLQGEAGYVQASGNYATAEETANIDIDIKNLHLAHAQPFVNKYLTHLDGRIDGNLKLNGPISAPDIRGRINADSVETIYAMTGTYLRIPQASFNFEEDGLLFDNVTIEDSIGHKGILNGRVSMKDFSNPEFSINLEAKNFEVVGRKKIADQGIYGPTNADLNITLKGNMEHLNLEGKVNIVDRSEFTYVYRSAIADQIGDGLIEFFDPSKPADTTKDDTKKKSALATAMDMNLYINITPASTITIITDEISGDHLKAKGKADLNYVMKSGGVMELLGTYVLDGGEYDLSLGGLIRKSFKIEKGSTINWSGDPLKGRMDITAKYELRAAAGPLLNDINHTPGIDKQKLNFQVLIMLKKELLKPDISFKLDMPESEQQAFDGVVYSRIKQVNAIPAELNKQVMGLLAFGQFIAENPFNSFTSSGGDFQSQAFNTAGQLLTQELTNLVGRYLKDVNVDFGLETEKDYTSGKEVKRTDLKVGVSKSFADNRLNIYVGSNFALEGTNQNEDAISGLAGDITMEYLLTPDGKYRLKGYRLTDNELVFQGSIVRTGLSFVVVLEFNNFKDLRAKQKKKQH